MRILHLTDRLTDRGGAHWHLLGVIAALQELGHDVHLAAGADDGHLPAPCPTTLVAGLESRTRAPAALDALVADVVPDVVHVHTVVNPGALEWAATRGAVVTVQDHRSFCPTRGKWTLDGRVCAEPMREGLCAGCFDDAAYFRDVYALTTARLEALRRFRAVVVLSRYMQHELTAVGVAPERVSVVPPFVHGVDPTAEADGPPCVLYAGRLTASKGIRDAIDAWRRARLDLPLVVAGTGPLRAEAEAAGAEVLGWVDHQRLSALFRRARALLLPSRWQEPFAIVGVEALEFGVPVVAWASGGVVEWHPGTPPLVPWGDVEGLAAALRQAVIQAPTSARPGDRDGVMRRLLEVYERIRLP